MTAAVVDGAMMKCMFGQGPPAQLTITPHTVKFENKPVGTIMDFVPNKNIPTFGMCMSMMNPQVISATAAAMGVLTPQPCQPMTVAPWVPGCIPPVMVNNLPANNKNSMCTCMWAPMGISITNAGTTKTDVP